MGVDHSQMVKATPIASDSGSKDCVNLSSSTAVSRFEGTFLGITGTNGKTTTTALTGAVLAAGDRPVLVGGNIGDTVLDRLDEITPRHWVVLELSSFQLESVERPRLHVGVILNITPDHLDRHHTFENYADLKARAIEFAEPDDYAVLNGRDKLSGFPVRSIITY